MLKSLGDHLDLSLKLTLNLCVQRRQLNERQQMFTVKEVSLFLNFNLKINPFVKRDLSHLFRTILLGGGEHEVRHFESFEQRAGLQPKSAHY